MDYCLGFLTDPAGRVLLIEKRRPAWQAGRLNGIGGKLEEGETCEDAMRRECAEETGLVVTHWTNAGLLTFPGGQVHVFHAEVDLELARALTDELLRVVRLADALEGRYPLVDEVQGFLRVVQTLTHTAPPPRLKP